MKSRSTFLWLVLTVALSLSVSTAHGQGSIKTVRIAYPAISYNQIHIWVGKEAGIFKKHGIEAELVFIEGGRVATQALVAGEAPFVNIGTIVQANLAGSDAVLVAASENTYAYSLITKPDVSKAQDLKGTKLGVSGFGSASHNAMLIALKHLGLNPNRDVMILQTGGTSKRIAALKAGGIDGTILSPSEVPTALKLGYKELLDIADLNVPIQGNGLATTRTYIKANRSTVKAVVKGYAEAVRYIKTHEKETKAIMSQYMRNPDRDVLESGYKAFVRMVPNKPYPTLEGIQFLLDDIAKDHPKAKQAKPADFVDTSFLDELEKEGFFKSLGL
ncbi:MAG: ABC transporter substrate-binding protein [Candidatus Tectomicrobia bacterium]|uniref:ABC transporter substrate-binding protein n=1 Tax=Tectimicrobiota bacterium TaxID=2528274 RepID=A0A932M0B2_UNCTE|nr:ABC transporter substrate-binding protein [Candidatus Tectomicrobia bacterium]